MVFLSFFMLLTHDCFAYVIIAVEEGSVVYGADNKLSESAPTYKVYYEVDENKKIVKRTKLVVLQDIGSYKKGDVIPDDTTYQILETQMSFLTQGEVLHAVGKPGLTAIELLTIGKDFIMASKHNENYVVICNLKIIERSDIAK